MNINWANHASKIEPQQIIDYLEKNAWVEQTPGWRFERKVRIFQKIVEGGLYQVTIPMSRELHDYASAMLRALVEISDSEEANRVRKLTAKILAIKR